MRLICPVSGTENEDREECKQCGTDLRPLIRVSEFPSRVLQEGELCLERERLTEAVENLSTAAVLHPHSAEIHRKLAEAFTRLELYQPALEHLDRAAALAPDRTDIRETRDALEKTKKEQESKSQLEGARNRRQRLLLRYIPVATMLLGVLLALAVHGALRQQRQPRLNWAQVVQQNLNAYPITRALNLKVSAQQGAVQIAGEIPNELYRELVFQVASRDVVAEVNTEQLTTPQLPALGTYRIRSGDSWWVIARRKYGNPAVWPQLEKANAKQNAARLRFRPGETIILPPITIAPR